MTIDAVFDFLDENGGKKLRIFFSDGSHLDCKFEGFSYDYDEDDNEIAEFTFKRTSDGAYFDTTADEIEKMVLIRSENAKD